MVVNVEVEGREKKERMAKCECPQNKSIMYIFLIQLINHKTLTNFLLLYNANDMEKK